MTNVEALKVLFIACGGTAEDFTAQTNPEAIVQVAAAVEAKFAAITAAADAAAEEPGE